MLRLDPPIWLRTPKGEGVAHIYINNGSEGDNTWVVFHMNGEIWEFPNSEVRAHTNVTLGRTNPDYIGPSCYGRS